VESGEWRVESGEWRVESGRFRVWVHEDDDAAGLARALGVRVVSHLLDHLRRQQVVQEFLLGPNPLYHRND